MSGLVLPHPGDEIKIHTFSGRVRLKSALNARAQETFEAILGPVMPASGCALGVEGARVQVCTPNLFIRPLNYGLLTVEAEAQRSATDLWYPKLIIQKNAEKAEGWSGHESAEVGAAIRFRIWGNDDIEVRYRLHVSTFSAETVAAAKALAGGTPLPVEGEEPAIEREAFDGRRIQIE